VTAAGLAWQDQARCAEIGVELFFPDSPGPAATAKRICMQCEVRQPCLEYALATDEPNAEHGIWAGLSPRERRALARKRGAARPAAGPALYPGVATAEAARAAGVDKRTIQRRRRAALEAVAS